MGAVDSPDRADILRLAREGKDGAEIEAALGCTRDRIYYVISSARKRGELSPGFRMATASRRVQEPSATNPQQRKPKSVTESAALYEPIQVSERDRMRVKALLASTGAMDLAEMLGVA
jgi:hypothetical protein